MGYNKNESLDKIVKRNAARERQANTATVVWLNPQPTMEEAKWLDENEEEGVIMLIEFLDGMETADTLSIKMDNQSGRWMATFFANSATEDNRVPALSVRAGSPNDALVLVAYMFDHRYKGLLQTTPVDQHGRWG